MYGTLRPPETYALSSGPFGGPRKCKHRELPERDPREGMEVVISCGCDPWFRCRVSG